MKNWQELKYQLSWLHPQLSRRTRFSVKESMTTSQPSLAPRSKELNKRCGIQSGIRAKLSALREKRNKAWNELQRVKHRDTTDITSLATCFHKYLREYNKASQAEKKRVKASTARRLCSKNFVKFARDVLAGEDIQNAPDVEFSQDAAEEFFFRVYDSVPMAFEQPSWLPDTPLPQNQFLCFSM